MVSLCLIMHVHYQGACVIFVITKETLGSQAEAYKLLSGVMIDSARETDYINKHVYCEDETVF